MYGTTPDALAAPTSFHVCTPSSEENPIPFTKTHSRILPTHASQFAVKSTPQCPHSLIERRRVDSESRTPSTSRPNWTPWRLSRCMGGYRSCRTRKQTSSSSFHGVNDIRRPRYPIAFKALSEAPQAMGTVDH